MTEDTLNDAETLAGLLRAHDGIAETGDGTWGCVCGHVLASERGTAPGRHIPHLARVLAARIAALARDRDALAAKALEDAADAIQALHPGEVKNSVTFLRDRATRIRAALAGPEDTARDTQRDNEGSGSVKGCGYCGYGVGHTTDECVRVSKPPARPVPADHGTDRADEEGS
jgi:hypothetical protein